MNSKIMTTAVSLALFQFFALGSANAAVSIQPGITFEDVAVALPAPAVSPAILSNGFSFSTSQIHAVQSTNLRGSSNGTNYLVYLVSDGYSETFQASDNSAFNLNSIDMGGWYNFGASDLPLTITGHKVGGATVKADITILRSTFSTYSFSNFTNLQSVTLGSVVGDSPKYVAVDNIITSPVPEPETYALMVGGLALVGWAARRRKAV